MSMKSKLVDIWNDDICERTNRKAVKSFYRANRLWHSGGRVRRFWAMMIHARNIRRYNCEIYPQAVLGKNLHIPHCVGIVVGSTAVIGDNCTIYPNVVFGARYSPGKPEGKRRHATVGNGCVFGANASIIGAITIGNHVTVGAGAVITKDVPENAIVVGNNRIIGYREES